MKLHNAKVEVLVVRLRGDNKKGTVYRVTGKQRAWPRWWRWREREFMSYGPYWFGLTCGVACLWADGTERH